MVSDDIDKLFSLASLPTPSPHDEQLTKPWAKAAILNLQTQIVQLRRDLIDAKIANDTPDSQAGNLRTKRK